MPPVSLCSLVWPGFINDTKFIPCAQLHYDNSSNSSCLLNAFRAKNNSNTHVLFWVCLIFLLVHKYMSSYLWGILSKILLGYFQHGDWPGACSAEKESPSLFLLCSCFSSITDPLGRGHLWPTNDCIQKTRKKKHWAGGGAQVVECLLRLQEARAGFDPPHLIKLSVSSVLPVIPSTGGGPGGRQVQKDQKCKALDYIVSSQWVL